MEMVRKFVDAESLMSVMSLPETFRNRTLEVLVFPTDTPEKQYQAHEVSGIIDSLVGAIPGTELSLEELREERLKRYETSD